MESVKDGETQEEVTTCRMQQDVSEWLVDEFMLLMWTSQHGLRVPGGGVYAHFRVGDATNPEGSLCSP